MKKETKKTNDNVELTIKFNKTKILKGLGIAAIVIGVLVLAFCVSKTNSGSSSNFSFIEITIDDYLEKMKESDKSIIYVARPGCSWCQKEKPIIQNIGSKYNLKIYYLNTDPFFDNDANDYTEAGKKFMASSEKYNKGWGTPNTIIVQNGEIVDGVFGYVEADKLTALFKEHGFLNEK